MAEPFLGISCVPLLKEGVCTRCLSVAMFFVQTSGNQEEDPQDPMKALTYNVDGSASLPVGEASSSCECPVESTVVLSRTIRCTGMQLLRRHGLSVSFPQVTKTVQALPWHSLLEMGIY